MKRFYSCNQMKLSQLKLEQKCLLCNQKLSISYACKFCHLIFRPSGILFYDGYSLFLYKDGYLERREKNSDYPRWQSIVKINPDVPIAKALNQAIYFAK